MESINASDRVNVQISPASPVRIAGTGRTSRIMSIGTIPDRTSRLGTWYSSTLQTTCTVVLHSYIDRMHSNLTHTFLFFIGGSRTARIGARKTKTVACWGMVPYGGGWVATNGSHVVRLNPHTNRFAICFIARNGGISINDV